MLAARCYQCRVAWESPHPRPGRTETCTGCGADLSCCRNCRFYSPGAPNDCAEPNTERVVDKEKANFCDYFDFARRDADEPERSDAADDAHQKFEDLFKN